MVPDWPPDPEFERVTTPLPPVAPPVVADELPAEPLPHAPTRNAMLASAASANATRPRRGRCRRSGGCLPLADRDAGIGLIVGPFTRGDVLTDPLYGRRCCVTATQLRFCNTLSGILEPNSSPRGDDHADVRGGRRTDDESARSRGPCQARHDHRYWSSPGRPGR